MKPHFRDGKITAVVPVYESAERLPGHIASLRSMKEVFADFIWVVTPGRDGSDDLARAAYEELGGTYLEVPSGLYEAWNAGIRVVSTEFVYISTVGETASALGLDQLRHTLQTKSADVVFTPPILPSHKEERRQLLRWPIFRFRRELQAREGRVLSPFFVAGIQASAGIFCILGSCASCLFRTSYLQKHPFPSGYHHYGDSAWVYQNYRTARMVYRSEPVAGFAVHGPSGRHVEPRDVEKLRRIILRDWKTHPQAKRAAQAMTRLLAASRYLDRHRGLRPRKFWWLRPDLLCARHQRDWYLRKLDWTVGKF